MEDGRVRACGTHDELLGTDELYRELIAALHIGGAESRVPPRRNVNPENAGGR